MKTNHGWKESPNERLYFFKSPMPANDEHAGARILNLPKRVTIYCAAPHATVVELLGDFSQWHPVPMERSTDGWWLARVELPPGLHPYRFLVDGLPVLDPCATSVGHDPQGERASLIAVG